MSERAATGLAPARPELVSDGSADEAPRWFGLLTSSDHKDVGRLYIGAALSFLFLGAIGFLLMRVQLAVPENDLISPVIFDRLLSVNGATLVVLSAIPLALGLFTYVVPLQIGARGVAFPRLGALSLWLYVGGGAILYSSFAYTPPETGVNPLPPLSDISFTANNGPDAWIAAVGLATLGFVLQAINLIVTIRRMRAPGMAWRRLPLFSWSGVISAYVLLIAGSAMLAGLTMLEIDRHFDGVFFEPGEGGAPTYWQHLSWFFFTGAWLLMLLPAIGAISEILPVLSGKPIFNRTGIAVSMIAIATLGMLAWMQNMFSADIPIGFLYMAMAAALALIVPIGLILFNWIATLIGGDLRFRAPLLFALAAISTLTIGLSAELGQSVIPVAWQVLGTTDSTGATGYVLVGGTVLGGLAALHFWFPKMTGRTMSEGLAKASLAAIFVGVHVTFVPMFLAGVNGQPVDVYKFYEGAGLDGYNLASTIGAVVLLAGIAISCVNAIVSVGSGTRVGHDPWGGETLEWYAESPPPAHNFDVVPDVRSDEPLQDIRESIKARGGAEPAAKEESSQPVA